MIEHLFYNVLPSNFHFHHSIFGLRLYDSAFLSSPAEKLSRGDTHPPIRKQEQAVQVRVFRGERLAHRSDSAQP